MPLHVRPATVADLPYIHAIYNDAILTTTATWDEAPWPYAQREAWWHEHAEDPGQPVFAAEIDGEFAGFAYLSLYRPKSGYRFTRENTVYVEPRFHGQGVGRALLECVLGAARSLDVHTVIAVIESTNEASLALHRSLGYEVVGTEREVGFKFNRWLDSTYMQVFLQQAG